MTNANTNKYGTCSHCRSKLEPIYFIDEETKGEYRIKTGRKRLAVDYLECPICGHTECIDDSFDGPYISADLFKKIMEARKYA